MTITAARAALAAAAPSGVFGLPRPPGHISTFPALIVGDPSTVTYHAAHKARHEVIFPVRVMVARSAEQDSTAELDDLVSYGSVPAALEAVTPTATILQVVCLELDGPYTDIVQDGAPTAIAADLTVAVTLTTA